jgi:hypothetical protein
MKVNRSIKIQPIMSDYNKYRHPMNYTPLQESYNELYIS